MRFIFGRRGGLVALTNDNRFEFCIFPANCWFHASRNARDGAVLVLFRIGFSYRRRYAESELT